MMMGRRMMRPKGIWDGKKTWEKTDGYKKFFNRNWYFQATTASGAGASELRDFFCECYGWLPGMEGSTGRVGYNHTIERMCDGKLIDYPNWKVYIRHEDRGLEMVPKMFCNMDAPARMEVDFMCFPEDERRDQAWTWFGSIMGMEFMMIASLEPRMSDEAYQNELKRLETENGIDLNKWKFTRVKVDPNHVPGSLGEDFVNPPAGGQTA